MKAYILKVVGAALLAAFSEYLVPKEFQKYMKLVSGLIIMTVLISPFTGGKSENIFKNFELEEQKISEGNDVMYENIKKEAEKKIAKDIEERVFQEFSEKVEVKAKVMADDEGRIEGVKRIELYGTKRQDIEEMLKSLYGAGEVIWN